MIRALALRACALAGLLVLGACNSVPESNYARLDDISYVLPTDLPDGYVMAYATERPGRPAEEWESHVEIYSNTAHDEFLIVAATLATGGKPTKPTAPSEDGPYDPGYAIAYVNGGYVKDVEPKTLQSHWKTSSLALAVMHVAQQPNAKLVMDATDAFRNETNLRFEAPRTLGGLSYLGAVGEEVTDYTMVFTPKRLAGRSRDEAIEIEDDQPSIGINVGAHFYGQRPALTDLEHAKVTDEGSGRIRVEFVRDGVSMSVGAEGISRDELLAVAKSLKSYDRSKWASKWGERLVTQDPPDEP